MKANKIKAIIIAILLMIPALGYGQIAPDLKSAADFGILAGVSISFNGPVTVVDGMHVGLHPGDLSSITGSYSVINGGKIYAADYDPYTLLVGAKQDLEDAYDDAAGQGTPYPHIFGDQGGITLAPGVYKSTSTLLIQSGDLTLDAQGDEDAVWIFQITSDFTTVGGSPFPSSSGGNVKLTGGARAENVFWQVGSSATIGDYTDFKGTILALTSISVKTGARVEGRLLARNASVTFAGGGIVKKPEESMVDPGDLTITKTASPQTFSAVGDKIEYEIVVENTGTAETLSGITVEDNLTGSSWPIASLAPGDSEIFATTYFIKAEDLLDGIVLNIATAETGDILVSAFEAVTFEEAPLPVPLSTWALAVGGILIAGFVFFRYRRSLQKGVHNAGA